MWLNADNPQLTKTGELHHLLTLEGLPAGILREILDTASSFVGTKVKKLLQQGLIEALRVYNTDRDATRLLGGRGELEASLARTRATISEIRLQIIAVDETGRTEAQRELSTVQAKISELQERRCRGSVQRSAGF